MVAKLLHNDSRSEGEYCRIVNEIAKLSTSKAFRKIVLRAFF